MAYKVLLPQDIAEEGKDYLISRGYEIKLGTGGTEEELIRDVEDCHAILLRTAGGQEGLLWPGYGGGCL